jgi:hypothetical protein
MATDTTARLSLDNVGSSRPAAPTVMAFGALMFTAYLLGAIALAGEAAVHIQQYALVMHDVRWVGPLFLVNAGMSIAAAAGLVLPATRLFAALIGVASSAVALAALVVSYGRGFFGWFETGFRTPVELAVISEIAAVIFLSVALAVTLLEQGVRVAAVARVGTAPVGGAE